MRPRINGNPGFFCVIVILLFGCISSGCTSSGRIESKLEKTAAKIIPFYEYSKTLIDSITVQSDTNSNRNTPVSVDIVFILDTDVVQALSGLSGPEWFANKVGLVMRYQQDLLITELEIVPQTAAKKINLPNNYYDAKKVFLFANYLDQRGQYQADISQFYTLRIVLNKNNYTLEELDP